MHPNGTLGILSQSELDRDVAGVQGTFGWSVQSGAVTFSSGLILNVAAIAAGDYTVNSATGALYAGSTVTLSTQDPTNPRVDIIVITAAGAVSAVAGTPAALTTTSGPVPPTPSSSQLEIARIFVPATGTPLSAASITDRRHPLVTVYAFFDSERVAYRATRRLVASFTPTPANASGVQVATGFMFSAVDASDVITNISGEPVQRMSVATAGGPHGIYSAAAINGSPLAVLSPNHSPRMLIRVQHPASSANVTRWVAGFWSAANTNTPNGAFLRIVTTGNVFFVTDQGGVETTTDLGALSRTTILGYEIETADAGVTWVCRNQAGTALATHTTNVPTAASALCYGIAATTATGAIPHGSSLILVEGTFA